MKTFYDSVVPKAANKLFGKQGAQVQPFGHTEEDGSQYHAMSVTPEMKKEYAGAVPAFAKGGEVEDNEVGELNFSPVPSFVPYYEDPEYQNWFGKSKTHRKGVPVTYYTGTSKDKDFDKFNVGRHGAWFTADPSEASEYAKRNDSQGYKRGYGWEMIPTNTASRVIPVHLKIENPYTGPLPESVLSGNYKKAQSDWFDTLRAKGHDGWIPEQYGGQLAVVLKEPHQIKTVFNRTWDPKNPRMDKAQGGEVGARFLNRVHRNPSVETLRNIAKQSPHESARIAIDKKGDLWAGASDRFLHQNLGDGETWENVGQHDIVGYVTHHNGDFIYGAWDKGSNLTKPSSHPRLDRLAANGFINGTEDQNNFSTFAQGGEVEDDGITAYHGSPHDFDQFLMDKIGTGEGAQAYGHGLYFAESEPVAEGYRDQLALKKNQMTLVDKTTGEPLAEDVPGYRPVQDFFNTYAYDLRDGDRKHRMSQWDSWKEGAARQLKDWENFRSHPDYADPETAKWAEEQMDGFRKQIADYDAAQKLLPKIIAKPLGHMYEVRINAHPDHFLDWEKPLSEQGGVKKFLTLPDFARPLDDNEAQNVTGQTLYNRLEIKLGPQKAARALHSAGIPGIKYLDAGSRGAGEGSRNYVVFDDKLINVKRKYADGGVVEEASGSAEPPKEPAKREGRASSVIIGERSPIVDRALMLVSRKA
jgi:hypothetical protein